MNSERLYINGEQIDLMPKAIISRTLQVNDISSLENRQSNFSSNIEVPKTPNNIKIFNYLGVVGNSSNIPYQKNQTDYYIGNECMVYNGWATVSETTNTYKINIYDGVIDLYKSIDNETFSSIQLSALTHQKTLSSVLNSWTGATPYKYILADYNGKAKYNTNHINIDYLVPSVNVSWLWNQSFNQLGFTYSGSTFQTNDFTNLWMTYPKGVLSTTPDELEFESNQWNTIINVTGTQVVPNTKKSAFFKFNTSSTNLMESIQDNTHFTVSGTSQYRIEISGQLKIFKSQFNHVLNGYFSAPQEIDIWLCKNANTSNVETLTPFLKIGANIGEKNDFNPVDFSANVVINLNHGESFSLMARTANQIGNDSYDNLYMVLFTVPLDVKISKVTLENISFQDGLQEFRIKDFLTEIVQRFGLTIFKDKDTNNYTFLTLEERINNASVIDWSSKFNGVVSEKYVFGSYAQNNWLKYSYNDENCNYKDGLITIDNINLEDKKDVLKSKIYAPEKDLVFDTIPTASNVYKLWDKEVSENNGVQEIKYKALDKRFCFLRSNDTTIPVTNIGSESLVQTTSISSAPIESFSGLSFSDVVQNYYPTISSVLKKAKIINAKINFNPTDISNFDFKKIYYIAQLGGYFLVNKINSYNTVNPTSVELIKVEYLTEQNYFIEPPVLTNYYITLTSLETLSIINNIRTLRLFFDTDIQTPFDEVTLQITYIHAGEVTNFDVPFPSNNSTYVDFNVTNFIAHEGYPDYTIQLGIIKDGEYYISNNTLVSTH